MNIDSMMPVSTHKIAIEKFSEIETNNYSEVGKKLNDVFFNIILKSMFSVNLSSSKESITTQLHQQLYLDTLTKQLSNNFDVGFSKLQFKNNNQGRNLYGY